MNLFNFFRRVRLFLLLALAPMTGLLAASESYMQSLTGHLKKGDSLTVIDDKFLNLPMEQWNQLKHLSIDNVVTFMIRRDTSLVFATRPFTCTLNVTIKYFTSRDQQTPKEIDSVKLLVTYDTIKGKPYADIVRYRFKNAFKVTVIINSISSPEWGDKLPDVFRLSSQILVERKYPVDTNTKGKMHLGAFQPNEPQDMVALSGPAAELVAAPIGLTPGDGSLLLTWNPADFATDGNISGTEEFDVEWTYIDGQSDYAAAIQSTYGGPSGPFHIPSDIADSWMLHDATRVTVTGSEYTINLPYPDGYVLLRIRGAGTRANGLRWTGPWSYDAGGGANTIFPVSAHMASFNWQYTASFAEEGKRKEVITYFDATQRSRQSVTINNSDLWTHADHTTSPVAVVKEVIYDMMGRPAVDVLPAPVKNSRLDYFPAFNQIGNGVPYTARDIVPAGGSACQIRSLGMETNSGASQYYSYNNTFLTVDDQVQYPFNPYIPYALNYPFSVTEYTPDATGRVRQQGGVGEVLQNWYHGTNYFYGKPTASQLQRMFGMEVGDASHYQKNMVVDPNGQASVSYIDANGKTIATALTGNPGANFSPLPTSNTSTAQTHFNDVLIRPVDMKADAGNLSMSATASFLVELADPTNSHPLTLHYSVDPLALMTTYGGSNQLCNNCYYNVAVKVTDICGAVLASSTSQPFQGSDFACHSDPQPITQDLSIPHPTAGEIHVSYTLQLSNDVINAQTDYYVQTNTDLKQLQTFFEQELNALDLSGCYNTCQTCKALPKTVGDFTAKVQSLLQKPGFTGVTLTTGVQTWINNTYATLVQNCANISCMPASPCEQKLDQLKQDVLPGGQYALYDATAFGNGSPTVFLEPKVNVMMQYNQDATISALTFVGPDGTTQSVGSLSQADFVRAYLQHPEWADYFVKYHIEYCSYLWCKDASYSTPADNNEVSYTFDANLQQNYSDGADAVTAGYYNHADPMALLNKDPWFTAGRGMTYYSQMQSDLQNLSTALNMTPKDAGGNSLAGKNIIQLVDWALYCRPTDVTSTADQVSGTWTSCAPADNCRSVTMEWQLYLNYYQQLKKKYYRIAKAAYFAASPSNPTNAVNPSNPSCLDCFIGSDALSTTGCPAPGATSNYTIDRIDGNGKANWYLRYDHGAPFLGNYTISYYLLPNGFDDGTGSYTMQTLTVTAGATQSQDPVLSLDLPAPPEQLGYAGVFVVSAVVCTPTATAACAISHASAGDPGPCPDPSEFQIQLDALAGPIFIDQFHTQTTQNVWYVHTSGNLTRDVTLTVNEHTETNITPVSGTPSNSSSDRIVTPPLVIHAGQDRVQIGVNTNDNITMTGRDSHGNLAILGHETIGVSYTVVAPYVTCASVNLTPASTCTSNSNYALYLGKNKIFDDYIDLQDYTACLASTAPSASQATQNVLSMATNDLVTREGTWLSRLQAIRDAEFSDIAGELSDATLTNVVNSCYQVSLAYLNYAAQNQLPLNVVSTLPSGVTSGGQYQSFDDAFNNILPLDARQRGFGAELLDNVYPYDRVPYAVNPNVTRLAPDNIYNNVKNNLAAFQAAWNGQGKFGDYLSAQLGDDYQLTDAQLADLQTRLASGCPSPYLGNPAILPVAFVLPNPGNGGPINAYITCNQLTVQLANFNAKYPQLTANTQLYYLLYTSYLNHQFGYGLSYADYSSFVCPNTAFLYDKAQTPSIIEDVFDCAAGQIKGAYSRGGQDYDIYITQVRIQFRNDYISKCLKNQASANMEGDQYEYHYTLYYYDQSGNLVKTIPPEGVHLLSDQDVASLAQLPAAQDPGACAAYTSNIVVDQTSVLNTLSANLQNNTALAMEMWLYSAGGGTTRQVRMVTPDNQFMCQAAIANGNIWFEVYSLSPDGSGGIDMTLTNQAVAALPPQLTLQNWTHLMIQSPDGLTSGALQLYVDGDKLTNFAEGTAPTYPFEWEIAGASGGYQLPVMDVSEAQTFRLYKRLPTDGEIAIDYQNSCMSPATSLLGDPMLVWGLFNSPSFCNNNLANTTALPVSDRGVLTVSSNPDPGGTQSNNVLTGIQNTFTVEFWVNPNLGVSDNVPDPSNKYAGVDDEPPYAIFPTYGGTVDHANMGVAVGVDGITVFEHTTDYLPGVLDWRGTVNGWTHVAIVYNNLVPSLYVNGEFKATGVASQKSSISPSYNFGGGSYGYMPGGIDEVRIWSVARTQAQIAAAYQHSLLPTDQLGLAGYWPMDNSNGSTIYDFACGNHPAALLSPALTYTDGGPVAETKYVLFAGRFIAPNHGLPTNYAYNSLNQPVQQTTPDAGTSTFVYDRLGRLSISQNAEQLQPAVVDANNPAGRFSYTRYDALGRIAEVGEKLGASPLSDDDARDDTKLTTWLSSGNNRQATVTIYDAKPETWWPSGLDEGFPRKRVAATALLATGSDPSDATSRLAATYYRYDVDGNVAEVMQENKQLVANEKQFVTGSSGLKDIKYDYDLISGKVNKVYYQDGKWDQFYYQYRYDADNRLIGAYTSRYKDLTLDNWNQEALYRYYLHGPLARMELAPKGQTFASAVQGVDYAYTLQGWLKGVNGMALPGPTTGQTDMGGDGTGDLNGQVGTDVIAFTLGYYAGDYISIGGWNEPGWLLFEENYTGAGDLYNGNIEHATYSISQLEGGKGVDYDYHYDQLNRLVAVDRHEMNSSSGAGFTTLRVGDASNNYQERVSYDGNGNILTYLRNGTTAGARPLAMDNLTYNYNRDGNGYLVNNRLRHINDAVPAGNYPAVAGDPVDLHDQAADNYNYDKIGNLIGNAAENISRINWTVYGKMASIAKSGSQGLTFGYDASGNRITKTATAADGTGVTTHYVRDAQGSVLAVYQYKSNASGALTEADWTEQHLYGSSRLGMLLPGVTIPAGQPYGNDAYPYVVTTDPTTGAITSTTDPVGATGSRHYELTNHLGNVLATISDKPATLNASNILAPELLSAQDYYPFGMQMPGRSYLANSSLSYRYGFNGKEKDDEVMGAGNEIDYGMRVYDPRAGRFLSVDALTKTFPALTPYQYAGNSPIKFIDLDGAERYDPNVKPKGISLLEKATVPGGQYAPRTLSAGNYRLVGMVNEKGNDYWIARLWFRSGDRKGMYRDDYIIGVDGVFDFIKNAREYERRANQLEFVRSYWPEAGTDISIPEQYWHMWKQQASNPMTWLNIGMATVASLPGSTQSNSLAAKMGFEEDVSVMPSLSSRDIEGIASEAASRHAVNFECMQCSADIVNALKDEGVSGSILDLEVKNGGKWTNIYSDKAGEVISTNGHHRGVLVGGKVYDNIHTKGISFEEWQKDFHTPSGQFKIDKTDF